MTNQYQVSEGGWTRAQLEEIIQTHMDNVMGHYKGQCYAWDVINEAIDDNGAYRDSVFLKTFGTDYFAYSFEAAKRADPDVKL